MWFSLFCFAYAAWTYTAVKVIYALTVLSCIGVVLSERRNPIKSLAWVTALVFLPVVGLVFYLFFGRSMRSVRLISRRGRRKLLSRNSPHQGDGALKEIPVESRRLSKLAQHLAGHPLATASSVEIFTSGRDKFERLKADIRSAKKSIDIQYYIFADDPLGEEIADLLREKAKEGVRVRVLYDHVGSFSVRTRFFTRMRRAGVQAHPFFRVTFPQLANRINFRNHRKSVVIDSRIGYIGGMNIAQRYLQEDGKWRDTHMRLEGPVVTSLLYQFTVDWNFLKGETHIEPLAPAVMDIPAEGQRIPMQLLTSGPTDTWPSIAMLYQRAILGAQKSIYIQTPYFLPTDSLLKALQTAALSRIDVRIMLPRRSDSRMLRHASSSYITECLEAGIKVYLYEPGMLHAKTMTVDEDLSVCGSTNFDFRSFEHNFEGSMLIFDPGVNRRFRDIFFADMAQCTKLTPSAWRKRPLLQRMAENFMRLLSPIL